MELTSIDRTKARIGYGWGGIEITTGIKTEIRRIAIAITLEHG